jgi:uncharacterized BrkB/YihY/UPF0761 family membrane protein
MGARDPGTGGAEAEAAEAGTATTEELQRKRFAMLSSWARATADQQVRSGNERLEAWRARWAVVDAAVEVFQRDRSVAGTVLGSALAFRLFLFFVPVVLLAVGLLGIVGQWVERDAFTESTGISGELAQQMDTALSQTGHTRWLAVLLGLVGMATAGRSLSRVMQASSALAWRTDLKLRVGMRVLVNVVGILVALALLAVLVNRLKDNGVAAAGLSIGVALGVYVVGWLVMSRSLPRSTTDPGAGIPGAVIVALFLVALQVVSQWYLPRQVSGASAVYGAIGSAIAVLGWFFFLGRVMVFSFSVDAVLYERFGSLSQLVFSLPVLRTIPRKLPVVDRFFDLGLAASHEPDLPTEATPAEPPEPDAPR